MLQSESVWSQCGKGVHKVTGHLGRTTILTSPLFSEGFANITVDFEDSNVASLRHDHRSLSVGDVQNLKGLEDPSHSPFLCEHGTSPSLDVLLTLSDSAARTEVHICAASPPDEPQLADSSSVKRQWRCEHAEQRDCEEVGVMRDRGEKVLLKHRAPYDARRCL